MSTAGIINTSFNEALSENDVYHLKPIMRSAKSYVRDTSDFSKKLE